MANEKEKITLPRAHTGEAKSLFVGINGVNYLVPKGQTVEVPKAVAEEIRRAQAAEDMGFKAAEAMMAKAQPKTY